MPPSNREKMSGNERYQTKRDQGYDMQRNVRPNFEKQPEATSVNGAQFERPGLLGTQGYHGEATPDPILDHIKGIRDETLPNYGRKDLKTNG